MPPKEEILKAPFPDVCYIHLPRISYIKIVFVTCDLKSLFSLFIVSVTVGSSPLTRVTWPSSCALLSAALKASSQKELSSKNEVLCHPYERVLQKSLPFKVNYDLQFL